MRCRRCTASGITEGCGNGYRPRTLFLWSTSIRFDIDRTKQKLPLDVQKMNKLPFSVGDETTIIHLFCGCGVSGFLFLTFLIRPCSDTSQPAAWHDRHSSHTPVTLLTSFPLRSALVYFGVDFRPYLARSF